MTHHCSQHPRRKVFGTVTHPGYFDRYLCRACYYTVLDFLRTLREPR